MTEIIDVLGQLRVRESSFELIQPSKVVRSRGRFVEAVSEPFSYWKADFQMPQMTELDYGKFLSLTNKVRVGRSFFRAYKTNRKRPLAMDTGVPLSGIRASGGGFDGTATIASISDPKQITVSGLPGQFQITEGDMVELSMSSDTVSLHEIGADAVANSSGVITLQLNNPIFTSVFTAAAVANFERASCLMQIIDAVSHSRGPLLGSGSFSAQEVYP